MSWRVAVTSADGVLINQHFGHAKWFLIYDVEKDGTGVLVEKRAADPWCSSGNHRDGEDGDSGIAKDITDCSAVLTAQVGPPARKKLELSGVSVFEERSSIDEALKKLALYYVKTRKEET
ncbi:MAG: dinitrogenase iron-molybdenum cofactor biosynthesis protein [Treponema sp.]|jgi:predicted Fe-Mo cluster-binding NifX family protein|nr:dinitrogenase iron-molybdenum cofactor biosynthesis protein [Treponema sp.]